MSVRTHTSSWRQLAAFAPLLIAASLFIAATQGEAAILVSRNVHLVLLPLSVVGWWVAWRLARVLTNTPVIPVAQARAGYVALRGTAQPMPDQPALTSPSGTPCVWYRQSRQSGTNTPGSYSAFDTVQPFLVVDDSGQCIVLPAGADITGGQSSGSERLIAVGDLIYVAGELRPSSADTLQQIRDIEPEPERVSVSFSSDDPAVDMRAMQERGKQMLKEARAAKAAAASARAESNRSAPPPLPVICAPKNGPFMISANKDGANEQSWYRLLAGANLVLLLGSGAMLSYLVWAGR